MFKALSQRLSPSWVASLCGRRVKAARLAFIYVIDQRGGQRKMDMPGVTSTRVKGLSTLAVAQRGKVLLFDFQNEAVLKEVKLPSDDNVTAIEFSPNFRSLIFGYDDGRVAELNLKSDRLRPYSDIGKGQVRKIDFLSDGTVVTAHHDQGVRLWRDGKIARAYGPYHSWVNSLFCFEDKIAFGLFERYPDYQVLFGTTPDSLQRLEGNISNSVGVAFIKHGKTLVTMGATRELKIWDLDLREPRLIISDIEIYCAMAVSPDERVIAAGTREGSVILYRADPSTTD